MQSPFLPHHTMVHVIDQLMGGYQSNGQYHLNVQNHGYYPGSPNHIHPEFIQVNRNATNLNRQRVGQV